MHKICQSRSLAASNATIGLKYSRKYEADMSCFTSAFAAPSKPSIVHLQYRIVGFQFCDERAVCSSMRHVNNRCLFPTTFAGRGKRFRRRDESVLPFLANEPIRAVSCSSVEPIISAKYDSAHIRSWVSAVMVLRSAHRTFFASMDAQLGSLSAQLELERVTCKSLSHTHRSAKKITLRPCRCGNYRSSRWWSRSCCS